LGGVIPWPVTLFAVCKDEIGAVSQQVELMGMPFFFHLNRVIVTALLVDPPGVGDLLPIVVTACVTFIVSQDHPHRDHEEHKEQYDESPDNFLEFHISPPEWNADILVFGTMAANFTLSAKL
jgi:hypothetical protein